MQKRLKKHTKADSLTRLTLIDLHISRLFLNFATRIPTSLPERPCAAREPDETSYDKRNIMTYIWNQRLWVAVLSLGLAASLQAAGFTPETGKPHLLQRAEPSHLKREEQPQAIEALLDRIGGPGTRARFETTLDESLVSQGRETFVITARNGKPHILGSTLSAITTGIGWYLNHYAHVNLAWNNGVQADLRTATLPLPTAEERRHCDADYRYYLNYCTFGYSMTAWTWDRWQREIDWMALHGINMPLQIIGLELVWKRFLMEDCGYTEAQAEAFVPGPAYTAWWGMNNLQGWGGDDPTAAQGIRNDAWYARQASLAGKILARQRELGMQPVLPGFSGMMPANHPGAENQGSWCGFQRPFILDPSSAAFADYARKYYARLEEVMGTSRYYSMDPFHEGGHIASGKYSEGYRAIYEAMNANCGPQTKWLIQQWQWDGNQRTSLTAVPSGRLVVLDLFSDGNPAFDKYNGYAPQEAVYCAIPNFGGRTGFFGRIPKMADNYFAYKARYRNIRGIGAAPEAIEQTPVVYDLLFELPWMGSAPDTREWMGRYVKARYGQDNAKAAAAWETLRTTALNNTTTLQGPHEAVMCSRPGMPVTKVSAWGGTDIFYKDDIQRFIQANRDLLDAGIPSDNANYSYDVTDIVRQTLTDYAYYLLEGIRTAHQSNDQTTFRARRDAFLTLILDLDRLLGTNMLFRLGYWTETARLAAAEVDHTEATADWYELNNARTLITTWGDQAHSEGGQLRDYSYRQWQGMLKDFYYPRWKYWFDHNMQAPSAGWFYTDWNWAHDTGLPIGSSIKGTTGGAATRTYYTAAPEGVTSEVAEELMAKYLLPIRHGEQTYYAYRALRSDLQDRITLNGVRGQRFVLPLGATNIDGTHVTATLRLDLDDNQTYATTYALDANLTTTQPLHATPASVPALLSVSDGTQVHFTLTLCDDMTVSTP